MPGTFTITWKSGISSRAIEFTADDRKHLIQQLSKDACSIQKIEFNEINFKEKEELLPILNAIKNGHPSVKKIIFGKTCTLNKIQNLFTSNNLNPKIQYSMGGETIQHYFSNPTTDEKPLKAPENAPELNNFNKNNNDNIKQPFENRITSNLFTTSLYISQILYILSGIESPHIEEIVSRLFTSNLSDSEITPALDNIFKELQQHQHKEARKNFINYMEVILKEYNSSLLSNFQKYFQISENKQHVETALEKLKKINDFTNRINPSHSSETFESSAMHVFEEYEKKIKALEEDINQKNLLIETLQKKNKHESLQKQTSSITPSSLQTHSILVSKPTNTHQKNPNQQYQVKKPSFK